MCWLFLTLLLNREEKWVTLNTSCIWIHSLEGRTMIWCSIQCSHGSLLIMSQRYQLFYICLIYSFHHQFYIHGYLLLYLNTFSVTNLCYMLCLIRSFLSLIRHWICRPQCHLGICPSRWVLRMRKGGRNLSSDIMKSTVMMVRFHLCHCSVAKWVSLFWRLALNRVWNLIPLWADELIIMVIMIHAGSDAYGCCRWAFRTMSLLHALFLSHHSGILPCENGAFLSDLHHSAGNTCMLNSLRTYLTFYI